MALAALRSRRLLPILSTLIISRHFTLSVVSRSYPVIEPPTSSSVVHFQSRSFKSTPVSYLSSRTMNRNDRDDEKLDPDAILFEGCDYNHWLITMDFPKGPKPSPEEMVQTYVQTCAKGLNISVEEAKKKIYACSTTTYQGFQAIMTEAESEQFQGLPGVVCILPDSYIDPVNKEYGGDKYINGTIIPRPPPVQHNRGRNDRNMPRDDNQRGPPGNFNNQQGPMQGDGRNFGPPRNMPQQNYGPPGQVPPPPPPPWGFCEGCVAGIRQGKVRYRFPHYRFPQGGMGSNFNQPGQGNYFPQDRRGPPPGDQMGFGPSDRGVMGDNRSYPPPGGFQNPGPGASEGYGPGARVEQGRNQSFGPRAGGGYGPGARVEQGPAQGFGPGVGGNYGPGGRAEQGPSHGFGPGIGYVPGARGEQGPGQGFVPGPGGGGGYGPGARGEQGPAQGFEAGGHFGPGAGGDYGKGNQVPMQGDGRNFGPPRNMPQQNYGPPGQVPPPPPPPGGFPQGGMGSNFNQPGQGNYFPQDRRGPPPGDQRGFGPSDQGVMGDNRNYPPPGGFQNPGPGASEGYGPGARVEQETNQSFGPRAGGGYGPGARAEQGPAQGFGPGVGGNYGPGGRAEQGPSDYFGPGRGYGPGARGEQGPGQGFVPGPGVGGGYGPGARGEQGPPQGFEAGGHFGQGNQGIEKMVRQE